MTAIRVLLADDIEEVRRDLRTALTLSGDVEIVGEAANGLEAVRLVESLQPDVVLMDLAMPVMDGCEAARQIKSQFPACRVVILTIYDAEAERKRVVQSGADVFLVKGVSISSLVKSLVE